MNSTFCIQISGVTKKLLTLFVLICLNGFSQKSEVVLTSGVKHNYAIGYDYYVEENIDTTKLLFMGRLKMITSNQDEFVVKTTHLLKIKAKELNGNSYKLKNFSIQDTTLTLYFDVYYAPDNQVALIKKAKLKDKVIVFNNIKDTLTRRLTINDSIYSFNRSKYLVINTFNQNIKIKIDSAKVVRYNDQIKPGQQAEFISVKANNTAALVYSAAGATAGLVGVAAVSAAYALRNKYLDPGSELLSNINYITGRILMTIYPMDKEISILK